MNVAVIGASDKPERYSYKAVKLLEEKGHSVYPVHKRIRNIEGRKVYETLQDIDDPIDTLSLYVSADISTALAETILAKHPRRIIFNPGAENLELAKAAKNEGIQAVNACTLVMLNTGQF